MKPTSSASSPESSDAGLPSGTLTIIARIDVEANGQPVVRQRVVASLAAPLLSGPEAASPKRLLAELTTFVDSLHAHTISESEGVRRLPSQPAAAALSSAHHRLVEVFCAARNAIDATHGQITRPDGGADNVRLIETPFTGDGVNPTLLAAVDTVLWAVGFDVLRWNELQAGNSGAHQRRYRCGDLIDKVTDELLRSSGDMLQLLQAAEPPRRTRSGARRVRPLTAKQREAHEAVCQHGSYAQAGRALNRDPKTIEQHYKAAEKKMSVLAVRHTTKSLAEDRRGQVDLSSDEDRRR